MLHPLLTYHKKFLLMYSYKCSDENLIQSMYYGLGFNCLPKTHMLKALILLEVGGIYKKSGLTE